jgi:hypothetical protein
MVPYVYSSCRSPLVLSSDVAKMPLWQCRRRDLWSSAAHTPEPDQKFEPQRQFLLPKHVVYSGQSGGARPALTPRNRALPCRSTPLPQLSGVGRTTELTRFARYCLLGCLGSARQTSGVRPPPGEAKAGGSKTRFRPHGRKSPFCDVHHCAAAETSLGC